MYGKPAYMTDRVLFSLRAAALYPPPLDQSVIHPDGAEVMSADRWKLIFSFSMAMKSIRNSLPCGRTPSVSSGASLNGLWCLHFVSSYRHTHAHAVCLSSMVRLTNSGSACQSQWVSQFAGSAILVWLEK